MDAISPRLGLIAVIVAAHVVLYLAGGASLALVLLSTIVVCAAVWFWVPGPVSSTRSAVVEPQVASTNEETDANRVVFDSLPDPLLIVETDGRILQANEALVRVFPQAAPGRLLSAAVRNPVLLDAVALVLKSGVRVEADFSMPPPEARQFHTVVVPLSESGGRRALVVSHDVTAAKQLDRVRIDFVANASHELRNPLSSLAGFIETLQGPAKDDPAARERFLAIMADQAGRMKRLIEDLLSLSRIEIDEHVPPSGDVDVAEVVEQVIDGLRPAADQADVEIRLSAAPGLPHVTGSRHELAQVFTNLIDNAIKYARNGKIIDVSVALRQGAPGSGGSNKSIEVRVRDYGGGIPQQDVPRLTERFYRVDPEHSRKEGGTGLGLAIVKHIVNRHKGRLAIESELGTGSTFTVVIPAKAESKAGTAA